MIISTLFILFLLEITYITNNDDIIEIPLTDYAMNIEIVSYRYTLALNIDINAPYTIAEINFDSKEEVMTNERTTIKYNNQTYIGFYVPREINIKKRTIPFSYIYQELFDYNKRNELVLSLLLLKRLTFALTPKNEIMSIVHQLYNTNQIKNKIFAIELGLSADTYLADMISELENKTFVTNSDAHSLPKIAREYNKMMVEDISFKEVVKALKNEDNRKVLCNYGLDPKLGKYHRTFCDNCNQVIETKEPVAVCPYCGSNKVTFGVFDRIELIKDKKESKSPTNRPPYIYQVPLTFIPGLGAKTIDKLLNVFGTEMDILHKLSKDDIESVVGEKVANTIISAREGNIKIQAGGGGVYGKLTAS